MYHRRCGSTISRIDQFRHHFDRCYTAERFGCKKGQKSVAISSIFVKYLLETCYVTLSPNHKLWAAFYVLPHLTRIGSIIVSETDVDAVGAETWREYLFALSIIKLQLTTLQTNIYFLMLYQRLMQFGYKYTKLCIVWHPNIRNMLRTLGKLREPPTTGSAPAPGWGSLCTPQTPYNRQWPA